MTEKILLWVYQKVSALKADDKMSLWNVALSNHELFRCNISAKIFRRLMRWCNASCAH